MSQRFGRDGLATALLIIVGLCLISPRIARAQTNNDLRLYNHAVFRTNHGDMLVQFLPEIAPKTVTQIRKLIALGLYDAVEIYRIERGFVAQLDDVRRRAVYSDGRQAAPLTSEQQHAIVKIPAEFRKTDRHVRGVLSMARPDNDIHGGETSFSFLLGTAPHLDNKYTIFARVVRDGGTLARIGRVQTGVTNAPRTPVILEQTFLLTPAEAANFLRDAPTFSPHSSTDDARARHIENPVASAPLTVLVILSSLATAFAIQRRTLRLANALALLTFLFAFFLFFSHLVVWQKPGEMWQKYYAVAAFLGALLCFKMMARFDEATER